MYGGGMYGGGMAAGRRRTGMYGGGLGGGMYSSGLGGGMYGGGLGGGMYGGSGFASRLGRIQMRALQDPRRVNFYSGTVTALASDAYLRGGYRYTPMQSRALGRTYGMFDTIRQGGSTLTSRLTGRRRYGTGGLGGGYGTGGLGGYGGGLGGYGGGLGGYGGGLGGYGTGGLGGRRRTSYRRSRYY